jgi:hypothetical protein
MRIKAFLLMALAGFSLVANAQEKTDRSYPTKRFDYVSIQSQIDDLVAGGKANTYHLAKAQAWLNSSKYEMWRNDMGWWPEEAYKEAVRTVDAIKNQDTASLGKTAQLKVEKLVADNLWTEVNSLLKKPKPCAISLIARAEVELVHVAYEKETTNFDVDSQLALVRSLLGRSAACK